MSVPLDANTFPPELLEVPQPVIGFMGLDCNKNVTHKSIWDAFNTNRKADRQVGQLSSKNHILMHFIRVFLAGLPFSLN